ncbi:hypothetical protein [Pseudalkalibacillus hwajinpoensis]|uniref:Uncharacterized protein n=1 Tax=Guptibacillus hwajinpoensis TaxID=208199 RepID=A0A4U1MN35_9BACL|nr:hypothetical protein [Pseudalkalibacillus hwajinpoensis]TKD71870.1 hypothetical protein FBF83_03455 [Pseudalkalibacillus hwajinpoensis]
MSLFNHDWDCCKKKLYKCHDEWDCFYEKSKHRYYDECEHDKKSEHKCYDDCEHDKKSKDKCEEDCHKKEKSKKSCDTCICDQLKKLPSGAFVDLIINGIDYFSNMKFINVDSKTCCATFIDCTDTFIVDCKQIQAIRMVKDKYSGK